MTWKELTREDVAEFQRVIDWLNDVSRRRTGSKSTRERYLGWLTEYCNYRELNPDQLLAEGDRVAPGRRRMTVAEHNLNKYFTYLETEKGLKRGTVKTRYGAVRSFLRSGEITFYSKTPGGAVVQKSVELKKDKLIECVQAATSREAYVICGLASTGMRPSDFVKLKYGDVQEDYEAREDRLYIAKESEKEDLPFSVFLSRQATRFLRLYLEERRRKGEVITKDTFLLGHEHPGRASEKAGYGRFEVGKPVTTQQLRNILKRAARRVGMVLAPRLFRKNFRTNASPEIGRDAVQKMAAWTIPGAGKHYFLPPRSKCLELYRRIEQFFTYKLALNEGDIRIKTAIDNLRASRRFPEEYLKGLENKWLGKPPETAIRHISLEGEAIQRIAEREGISRSDVVIIPKDAIKEEMEQIKKERTRSRTATNGGVPIGGGLPFELQARKALADILVGAVEDVKKRLAEKG